MSGHSKWANIKNRKGAVDKKRSEQFTKASKDILTAIRTGGGNINPESNLALAEAIEKARGVNMPRENIDHLLQRFEERRANLVSGRFEGFGLHGVPLIIEVETDNKNRTLNELKLIFRDHGGNLGSEGSVDFMFERVGEIEVGRPLTETEQLDLIDKGVRDFDGQTVLVAVADLGEVGEKIKAMGIGVESSRLAMRARAPIKLGSEDEVAEVMDLIEALEDHDDVVNVFSGFDFG